MILKEAQSLEGWTRPSELEKALTQFPEEEVMGSPPASSVTRMQEYAEGQLADALAQIREKGFDIGCKVSSGSSEFYVKNAMDDVVTVVDEQTQGCVELKVSDFLASFLLHTSQSQETLHPGWPFEYMTQKGYVIHSMKVRILHALHIASSTASTDFDQVELYEKPKRTVRTKVSLDKGALIFVPNTLKVHAKLSGDPVVEGEVCVSTPSDAEFACLAGIRFVLSPLFSKDMPCLAWAVRTTEDQHLANMTWTSMKITDVGVAEGPHEHQKTIGAAQGKAPTKASSQASASPKASASPSGARDFSIKVPVLINDKALTKSAELFVHRPPPRQSKRQEPAPVKLTKIMRVK